MYLRRNLCAFMSRLNHIPGFLNTTAILRSILGCSAFGERPISRLIRFNGIWDISDGTNEYWKRKRCVTETIFTSTGYRKDQYTNSIILSGVSSRYLYIFKLRVGHTYVETYQDYRSQQEEGLIYIIHRFIMMYNACFLVQYLGLHYGIKESFIINPKWSEED